MELLFDTIFAFVIFVFTLFSGLIIHLVYKRFFRSGKYGGITFIESSIIFIGSIPGLAGCGFGIIGYVLPVPLIIGLPLDLVFFFSMECGWSSVASMLSDPHYRKTQERFLVTLLTAWIMANIVIIGVLYFLKIKKNISSSSDNKKDTQM